MLSKVAGAGIRIRHLGNEYQGQNEEVHIFPGCTEDFKTFSLFSRNLQSLHTLAWLTKIDKQQAAARGRSQKRDRRLVA